MTFTLGSLITSTHQSLSHRNMSSNNLVEFPVDIASLPSLSVLYVSTHILLHITAKKISSWIE
jgi:hypothetical protein